MNLIQKELRNNFKSVLSWITIISFLIVVILLLHPIAVEKMDMMSEMIEQLPKELLRALNISNETTFNNILHFFFYELQFILVASSIFAGNLGANIIAKEENDKTIQFIYSKPISRSDILLAKLCVTLTYLLLFNIIIFGVTSITMSIVSTQTIDYLLLLNIFSSQLMIQITFSLIGMLVATSLNKPKSASSITSSVIIISFMFGIISRISDKIANLSYISPINYLSNDTFLEVGHMDYKYIIIMAIISISSIIISLLKYVKKDYKI